MLIGFFVELVTLDHVIAYDLVEIVVPLLYQLIYQIAKLIILRLEMCESKTSLLLCVFALFEDFGGLRLVCTLFFVGKLHLVEVFECCLTHLSSVIGNLKLGRPGVHLFHGLLE